MQHSRIHVIKQALDTQQHLVGMNNKKLDGGTRGCQTSADLAIALADNIGQPELDNKQEDCFVDDVGSQQDKSINQTCILQDCLVYPKSQPDGSINQPYLSHEIINQPHMSHDIIIQPHMSSLVTETDLDDVKGERDDTIIQLQMSANVTETHLNDVKVKSEK